MAAGLEQSPLEVLFSDGNAGERDIEFYDPKSEPPKVNQVLAQVFNHEQGLWSQYRAHSIPRLWGADNRETITRWFDAIGTNLAADDRLIVYFTGHGGRGSPARNTSFALWHEPSMSVNEFGRLLDRLPPKVSVVLVMVQCFSGGFSDLIYNGADPAKGLSSDDRCGFFATTFDRTAAGCTPDIDEEDYHDYSTSFWAALYGRTRTDRPIPPPDYNGDGRISFAEANAYALINSDTVDIPVKTSDEFLRRFSSIQSPGRTGLLTPEIEYEELLELADAPNRAVLAGLSTQLHLSESNRFQAARSMASGLQMRMGMLEGRKKQLERDRDAQRPALQSLLRQQWPELDNLFSPQAIKLIQSEGNQMIRAVESAPQYATFQKQDSELDHLEAEALDLERKWVKCQRFIRTMEAVALAANLSTLASPEIQERYRRILAAENASVGATPGFGTRE